MQTSFTLAQLADPQVADSEQILRTCVHCGFCTATCPTYVLLGDELDSPRGRIYLIKDMLENDRPATADVVKHIDRCLSCLACMTTCPSGVHYMHLVDHARVHIEKTYRRPLADRWMRALLLKVLPDNRRFRQALRAAGLAKPLAPLLDLIGLARLAAMLRLAPARLPNAPTGAAQRSFPAPGPRRGRVALLDGCVTPVIGPSVQAAAIRVLNRHGVEVVLPSGQGCCGGIAHHAGREREALDSVRANVDAWTAEARRGGARRHPGHRVRLRHHGQGLRIHAAQRSGLCGQGRQDVAARNGYQRVSGAARSIVRARPERPRGRLSRGLLAAACAENSASTERIAFQDRLRGQRCAGRTSVLRFGWDLQHSPAGACEEVARAQGRAISKSSGPM